MDDSQTDLRVDKYLWAVRLYKTRSLAAEECKKGRVLVNDQPAKASKAIREGDVISVRQPPIWRKYKIKGLLHNRVGSKLVDAYIEEATPPEELEKLEEVKESAGIRDRGAGRPTKKERREIEKFKRSR